MAKKEEECVKIKHTDSRNGLIIIAIEDDGGAVHEIAMNSMDLETLIGMLRDSQAEAVGHQSSGGWTLPGNSTGAILRSGKNSIFPRIPE